MAGMRPLLPPEMLSPIRSARALLPVLLVLAGCGAGKAAPTGGVKEPSGGSPLQDAEPSAPSFMKVGDVALGAPEPEVAVAPSAAASASPSALPGDSGGKHGWKTAQDPSPPQRATTESKSDASQRKPEDQNVRGAVVDSSGGLTEADVRATLVQKQGAFRGCYEIGNQGAGGFTGTVGLRVTINAAGMVAQADVTLTTTKNAQVDSCVLGEIRRMQFPAKGSGAVVSFPIDFGR